MNNESRKLLGPEVINKLNEFFNVEFPDIERRLNHFVIEVSHDNGHWMIPVVDTQPGKPTTPSVEQLENAFDLNAPGQVTVTFEKVPSDTVVIRNLLSPDAAAYASKSRSAFRHVMGPVINDMLEELRYCKGFNEDTISFGKAYATFKRFGSDEVLRETDAGEVEIRLYSDTSILPLTNDNKL